MTSGTNQPETWSARRWIGARLRCACATICTICASTVSRPILSARITKAPLWFSVPPITLSPALLPTGIDSPVSMDFIDRASPLDDFAIHRNLLAGPHAKPIADFDGVERDFLVRAIAMDEPRGLWRKIKQRADRAAGLLARSQLQHLPQQNESRDDRRRFEIDGDGAMVAAESRREQARRDGGDDAIGPRDADAHGDQREHVEIAALERRPAALEERPARPERDRRRERQLDPVGKRFRHKLMQASEMPAHLEHEDGDGERERDPEAPRHVDEFGARARRFRGDLRLQRHAADRAGAGMVLTNLRMHRAGVDRARGRRRRRGGAAAW